MMIINNRKRQVSRLYLRNSFRLDFIDGKNYRTLCYKTFLTENPGCLPRFRIFKVVLLVYVLAEHKPGIAMEMSVNIMVSHTKYWFFSGTLNYYSPNYLI